MPSGTQKLTSLAEVGGSIRKVQQAFSSYQVARTQFVNNLEVSLLDAAFTDTSVCLYVVHSRETCT